MTVSSFLLVAALLVAAAVCANLTAPRATPRLAPVCGVPLILGLAGLATGQMRPALGLVEAVAATLVALGLAIPLVSAGLAARAAANAGAHRHGRR